MIKRNNLCGPCDVWSDLGGPYEIWSDLTADDVCNVSFDKAETARLILLNG
jgi:hypothetical protein